MSRTLMDEKCRVAEQYRCTAKSKQQKRRCRRAAIPGGTVCAIHGGKTPVVAAAAKRRLLVAEAIKEFGLQAAQDGDRVLAEIAAIAFLQVGDLYDDEGQLLRVKAMPPHVQAAIANPETVTGNVDRGDGKMDKLVRVRQWDKPKMLELLAKHHGLAEERLRVDHHLYKWEGEE